MSADQVAELQERLSTVREAIARIEERQQNIISVLERHTSELAQWTNKINTKVDTLERDAHTIKTKLWLVALVSGAVFSTIWELIKARVFPR
jgi:t-SNARE complex subunit (syntaxin)